MEKTQIMEDLKNIQWTSQYKIEHSSKYAIMLIMAYQKISGTIVIVISCREDKKLLQLPNLATLILLDSPIEVIDIGWSPSAAGEHCCLY
jgi:hypothetical protein